MRKLDDCFSDSDYCDSTRMHEVVQNSSEFGELIDESGDQMLQFFVKLIDGKSILIRASGSSTLLEVMKMVEIKSGIPVGKQRVIYCGRQLSDEYVLNECGIANNSNLYVVARMRSIQCRQMWREVEDINHFMRSLLCSKEHDYGDFEKLENWISTMMINFSDYELKELKDHVIVLIDSGFPAHLMKLYVSVKSVYQTNVSSCIDMILSASLNKSSSDDACFYPLILQFGKMLGTVGYETELYLYCRKTLAKLVFLHYKSTEVMSSLPDILPIIIQTAEKVSANLVSQSNLDSSIADFQHFISFFELLKHVIIKHSGSHGCVPTPISKDTTTQAHALEVKTYLYTMFTKLLATVSSGLQIIDDLTQSKKYDHICCHPYQHYLRILELLYNISKLYPGAEQNYRTILGSKKTVLSCLILTHSRRADDLSWLIELKDLLDFKAKRHLVSLLFPDVHYEYDQTNELLIDRSNLLSESFEYFKHANRKTLQSNLFVEFKDEEAAGPGVLREWFVMVCQAIFYTGNPLFTACPNDRRRFYLNPASTVDPLHPDYLRFCGRVIALALRHNVHIDIVFDRVFFLQLSGIPITLEDIKVADPEFYKSCKQILNMDADFVDSDALGLTFVREVEQMGSREILELCPDGKNKVVNSCNRNEYVEFLILNRFVISTSKQLMYFTEGFGDILGNSLQSKYFFKILDLEDLDLLLRGSAGDVSVEDWKKHTVYNGYNESDLEIKWFWKIVGEMSPEQRRMLLFFWTSVKYLPPEGFHGLNNKLSVFKILVSDLNRLPTSQTCFYKLSMPVYSSFKMMQARLKLITHEHIGVSFGKF